MLTPKQHRLLLYISEEVKKNGYAPSYDEMRDALNLRSKSGIHRLIASLEERRFIRRLPHKARAIEIMRLPGDDPSPVVDSRRLRPLSIAPRGEAGGEVVSLPLFGVIAAGTPVEALAHSDRFIDVPGTMIGRGENYALTVRGDSMIDAGILDGDTVIIEPCESPRNGEIVVALIEDQEVTLKRLRRRSGAVALEPANVDHETRIFPPDRVRFQGRLIGLIRRY
ncbi:MAG: transcriptional repressor LexA, partial [Alphaproteobacteria bacterium]|nr:transcriptional repressor LexA [Alphaproteobacteria bacterium]